MRDKIIIMDDDADTRKLLVQFLLVHGLEATSYAYCNQTSMNFIHSQNPDLIILDVSKPQVTGLDVCTELRKFSDKPVLFISLHTDDHLRIDALNRGGDEYVTKPFSLEVLLARIKAHIRRYKRAFPINQRHLLLYPGLQIDPSTHTVIVKDEAVLLTPKEFQLLLTLAKYPNRVFQTEDLYDLIWKDTHEGDIRTVMVHVYNLRQKIEQRPRTPEFIHTVRGMGYKFNASVSMQENS